MRTTLLALCFLMVLQTCMALTKVRCHYGSQLVSNREITRLCAAVNGNTCSDRVGDIWCVHTGRKNANIMGNKCYQRKAWLVEIKNHAGCW